MGFSHPVSTTLKVSQEEPKDPRPLPGPFRSYFDTRGWSLPSKTERDLPTRSFCLRPLFYYKKLPLVRNTTRKRKTWVYRLDKIQSSPKKEKSFLKKPLFLMETFTKRKDSHNLVDMDKGTDSGQTGRRCTRTTVGISPVWTYWSDKTQGQEEVGDKECTHSLG